MKHATIIFCKILSGLYQQGIFTQKRKDLLLNAWQEAVKAEDKKKLSLLVKELLAVNSNRNWQSELSKLLEEFSI